MEYYIVLDIHWEKAFVRLPFGEDLELTRECAELMRSNPILHVIGIIDHNENIIEEYEDFSGYFDSI